MLLELGKEILFGNVPRFGYLFLQGVQFFPNEIKYGLFKLGILGWVQGHLPPPFLGFTDPFLSALLERKPKISLLTRILILIIKKSNVR
jgi:hypothetical protein